MIMLYCIFHIEYKDIELLINTYNNYIPDAPFAGAASLSFQYGELVNKAVWCLLRHFVFVGSNGLDFIKLSSHWIVYLLQSTTLY